MKLRSIVLALTVMLPVCSFAQSRDNGRVERLQDHVYTLAADDMSGRKAGSPDAARARDYIERQFTEMGLKPLFTNGYEYQFQRQGVTYTDVAGIILGNGYSDEYIVVGAHYDHLGINGRGEVFNGADDNASGTAAIIEVARELIARGSELKRNVIIAAFDAEELGLYGSEALCSLLSKEELLGKVKLMMSVDMVGWYGKSHYLKLEGIGTIESGKSIVRELAEADDINLKLKKFENSVFTATDTESFAKAGIPTLAITTGTKSPYHKPGDDPQLIDYQGLGKVSDYIADFTVLAASDTTFRGSGRVAEKHSGKSRLFEAAVTAYVGGTNMNFTKSGLTTKSGPSIGAGVSGQFNFKHFGLRADALYTRNNSTLPDPADVYSSNIPFRYSTVTVPLQVLFQTQGPSRGYLGVGAFYSYLIEGQGAGFDFKRNTFGVAFSLGAKVSHLGFSVNVMMGADAFTDKSISADPITTFAGISYYF